MVRIEMDHMIILQGELSLEWEESPYEDRFPYLTGCSIDIFKNKLYIFGGMDKDENMTNGLIRYDLRKQRGVHDF